MKKNKAEFLNLWYYTKINFKDSKGFTTKFRLIQTKDVKEYKEKYKKTYYVTDAKIEKETFTNVI